MSATLFVDEAFARYDQRIDCEEVRVIGELVWATPEAGDREVVVPLSRVVGLTGETVEQEVEALEAPGGQFTELVTDVR